MGIVSGEPVPATLKPVFELKRFSREDFFSLLFYMGFLTLTKNDSGEFDFVIPNSVMRAVFNSYFSDMFLESTIAMEVEDYRIALNELAFQGSNVKFVKILSDFFSTHQTGFIFI
jgi:hypothetical protein